MKKTIHHTFHFQASPEAIIKALMEAEHIRQWWTADATIESGRGVFEWKGYGWAVELHMEADAEASVVVWKCLRSNMQNTAAWEGSTMRFCLYPDAYGTRVEFTHEGYGDSPCYDACFAGWHHFLGGSLKPYLETGKGMPYIAEEWAH